ncbi:hypothetical protein ANN_15186 [Periplaneta americana]|uniref:Uncharacterized protein n=1 Tax=Periplaneta americana TaxID=6978 RepID=A0ABQ8SFN3_PERAM|nr:hypothetical protein ANN_15186 [Periplaneta americana]
MSLGSSTESYPAFARIGLRENPGKNVNQNTWKTTGVAQSAKRLPADPKLRSGVGSIPAWADYLVGFFPRFPPTLRQMSGEGINIPEAAQRQWRFRVCA